MPALNYIIGASADDARQAGSTMTLTVSTIIVNGANYAGLRFTGVALAASDTIDAATLTVEIGSATYDDPNGLVWRGELNGNPGTFTTAANNISSRSTTTASTTWSGTGVGTGDKTINVKTIVEELIAQGTWASGNAMAFIGVGAGGTDLRFTSWDGSTTTCARLDVTYTPLVGTGAMPKTATRRLSSKVGGLLVP